MGKTREWTLGVLLGRANFFADDGKRDKMLAVPEPPKTINPMPAEKSLPISVCLISGNEAHRIRRTLASVAGWTCEIIVVLNEDVSDGTDKIAAEFSAKIFREPWKGHIGQKNSAVQKASCDWILGLDADEEVSPELRAEIQKLFSAPAWPGSSAAFSFPRLTFYCGRWIRHGDWYPDRQTRLWRRGAAEWGGVDPHDKLLVHGSIGRLKSDLRHFSMENISHHARKTIGYSDLFARQRLADGKKTGLLELWFRPWWRFVRGYVLRRGFLDGWQGYVIARMITFETFLRYAKVREAQASKAEFSEKP
jgi:glycosyltransferase involved in cell wall biosynthesis